MGVRWLCRVLVVVVLAAAVPASPVGAEVDWSSSPSPLSCAGVGSVQTGSSSERGSVFFAPAGGTARLRVEGTAKESSYYVSWWLGFNPTLRVEKGSYVKQKVGLVHHYPLKSDQPQPATHSFTFENVFAIPSSGYYRMSERLQSFHGTELDMTFTVEVKDGDGMVVSSAPACALAASEFFGTNPALPGQCPCRASVGNPVDTFTGNEFWPLPGLAVAGRGPGLSFELIASRVVV